MFKWMISSHRGHKSKGVKLANNNNGNKLNLNNNNNNIKNQKGKLNHEVPNDCDGDPQQQSNEGTFEPPTRRASASQLPSHSQSEQQQRFAQIQQRSYGRSQGNLLTASRDTLDDSNEYTTLEQLHLGLQRDNLEGNTIQRNKSVEQISGNQSLPPLNLFGLQDNRNESLSNSNQRPPLTQSIGSQPNLNLCNSYRDSSQIDGMRNALPEAPGTCTLPRRSAVKEDLTSRYRCPSNPPPQNRQPPPYSRHQVQVNINEFRRGSPPSPPPAPPQRAPYDSKAAPYKPLPQNSKAIPDQAAAKLETDFQHWGPRKSVERTPRDLCTSTATGSDPLTAQELYLRNESNHQQSDNFAPSSKSTEDLLTASRVINGHPILSHQDGAGSQYDLIQTEHRTYLHVPHKQDGETSKHTTEILSSDSVYPAEEPGKLKHQSPSSQGLQPLNQREQNPNSNHHSHFELFRKPSDPRTNSEMTTDRPNRTDPSQVKSWETFQNQKRYQDIQGENHMENLPVQSRTDYRSRERDQYRDEFHHLASRRSDMVPGAPSSNTDYFNNRNELFISEKEEYRERSLPRSKPQGSYSNSRSTQPSTTKDSGTRNSVRLNQAPPDIKYVGDHSDATTIIRVNGRNDNFPDGSDLLVVKDAPTYPAGAPGREGTWNRRSHQEEERKTDRKDNLNEAIPVNSSSWMEWTQQLQAYVAWVNSQLRKRPDRPIVTDLRRDFQNGVVFADLIEIIANERIAGIVIDADTPQLRRENLDRILQFMAAKRIRMTHITSKEITEGNLKSIMRVILALAAHYKPQSVRDGSHAQEQSHSKEPKTLTKNSEPSITPVKQTHDVGVGPDCPLKPLDKTPSLLRKHLDVREEDEEFLPLKRQPSLTHTPRPSSPSPVYENILPKRGAGPSRWAYDSLRASHKFYWGSSSPSSSRRQRERKATSNAPHKTEDDSEEVMNSTLNGFSSQCTSLNTSIDGDVNTLHSSDIFGSAPFTQKANKPAALDFWKGLQEHEGEPLKKSPEVEADSPFRYNTVHRMSGRRKLPQIPGQSSPSSNNSRGTTPLYNHSGPSADISQSVFEDSIDRSRDRDTSLGSVSVGRGGNTSDETSREPEGRSQNSSPATSLVREPVVESWRQVFGQEKSTDEEFMKGPFKQIQNSNSKHIGFNGENEIGDGPKSYDEESLILRQEVIKHVLIRKALETEKVELSRRVLQRDSQIADLRNQLLQQEKTLQVQKIKFDETLRNIQIGKSYRPAGESPINNRCQGREELQLVREAIGALRSNFRGTDPNQHTLDTIEQAIGVLMERGMTTFGNNGTQNGTLKGDSRSSNANGGDSFTKVIYFTDRTVTPFMTSVNKRIGDVTLRDFKCIFDRPGSFRFHFKSQDPEYGLVKEEIINDDDILPGVEGKIIAWVEEDME